MHLSSAIIHLLIRYTLSRYKKARRIFAAA